MKKISLLIMGLLIIGGCTSTSTTKQAEPVAQEINVATATLDGSSQQALKESIIKIGGALGPQERHDFSDALQTIFATAKESNGQYDKNDILRTLQGKTYLEVIELANSIKGL